VYFFKPRVKSFIITSRCKLILSPQESEPEVCVFAFHRLLCFYNFCIRFWFWIPNTS